MGLEEPTSALLAHAWTWSEAAGIKNFFIISSSACFKRRDPDSS